ncbi:hypothetical protein ACJJTC_019815 [Scirpophaga incertulas]
MYLSVVSNPWHIAVDRVISENCQNTTKYCTSPIFNQRKPEHNTLLLNTIRKAVLALRMFNATALFTCMLWAIHPTILHIQKKHLELEIWLPFKVNSNPQFYISVVYKWIITSWVAFCNTTIDIFISFSFEQCKTQVSILRADMATLVQESKMEALKDSSNFNNILNRRFCKIIIHHKEIVNTVNKIQDTFSGALFYQFLVSSWILCTSVYRIVNVNPASVEFVSMITYTLCILTELLLFCFYGNEITLESIKLTDAAYSMDWLEMPVPLRRSLIIFMERIKQPIEPMAGSLVPLSNSTYVSILRSSYSFYAFLKSSRR